MTTKKVGRQEKKKKKKKEKHEKSAVDGNVRRSPIQALTGFALKKNKQKTKKNMKSLQQTVV